MILEYDLSILFRHLACHHIHPQASHRTLEFFEEVPGGRAKTHRQTLQVLYCSFVVHLHIPAVSLQPVAVS